MTKMTRVGESFIFVLAERFKGETVIFHAEGLPGETTEETKGEKRVPLKMDESDF